MYSIGDEGKILVVNKPNSSLPLMLESKLFLVLIKD